MPIELYRISREYIWWRVDTPNDLSSDTADVALLSDPTAIPDTTDWVEAALVGPEHEMGDGTNWWIRVLVGPDTDFVLTPNDYQSWTRINSTPERPVRRPGVVTIL